MGKKKTANKGTKKVRSIDERVADAEETLAKLKAQKARAALKGTPDEKHYNALQKAIVSLGELGLPEVKLAATMETCEFLQEICLFLIARAQGDTEDTGDSDGNEELFSDG